MVERQWPFVGRDGLLRRVMGLVDEQHTVVLRGPAGVGKSRLASECSRRLGEAGAECRRVAAAPSGEIPLAAIAPLLADVGADGLNAGAAVLHLLSSMRSRSPVRPIVVVDDLHALDDASMTVVYQLAASRQVGVVATVRSTVATPGVERLVNEDSTTVVDVEELTVAETGEMVEAALAGRVDSATVQRLHATSRGNALYVRDLIEGLLCSAALRRIGDVWVWEGGFTGTPHLTELVLSRLAPLGDTAADVLELLAVSGQIRLELLERVAPAGTIERLEREGFIAVRDAGGDAWIDVSHPLYREVLRVRMGAITRHRHLRTLCSAADSIPPRSEHEGRQRVVWRHRARLPVDGERLLAVALWAKDSGDAPLGAEIGRAAFEATGSAEALLVATWCMVQDGDTSETGPLLVKGLAEQSDPWAAAAIRQRLSEEAWWHHRDPDRAIALLETDPRFPDGQWNVMQRAQRLVFDALDGDLRAERQEFDRLLENPSPWVTFTAAIAASHWYSFTDRAERAFEISQAAYAAATTGPIPLMGDPGIHVVSQVVALLHAGRIVEARGTAELIHAATIDIPGKQPRGWATLLFAYALQQAGDIPAALRRFAEAETIWASIHLPGLARWCAAGRTIAAAALGDEAEAQATLDRIDGYDPVGFRLYEPVVALARCWVSALGGDTGAARSHGETAIERSCSSGATVLQAWVLHDLARLGFVDLAVQASRQLPAERSRLTAARVEFAGALASADHQRIEAAGDEFGRLDAPLWAGEAFSLAAAAARSGGHGRAALRLTGRAGESLAGVPPVHTPPLRARRTHGVLSPRESEIASLLADGLTNRQIGERLYVSERTVESHVYRIFIKLNVTQREHVASVLARR